ncbi:HEAT repeat domain-containing protein [Chondromyces crocatus]|uniref:Cyclic nucleotide-binding domain-containing protein n=1 Tax=Chondromyces crocatus TaxID=52 RepID=A0A0K1EFH5_CHOCO|nr:HEAT repeat domain-containing protein [Chondromyces crocatus]AKT39452.1 uncharacterized protein CMC5_035990 [Chondromyces crocatus]
MTARPDSTPSPATGVSRSGQVHPRVSIPARAPERPVQQAEALGLRLTAVELERSALLFALLFLAALLLVVGRTARDALFLTRFPVTWIGPMWIAYGVVSCVVSLVYAAIAPRLPRAKFTIGFALFSACTYVILRILIGHEVRAAYVIFNVWSEIIANFVTVLVWGIAQDLHDTRSAKRLFGLIGVGRIAGTVACGFGAGAAVSFMGTENLIFILVAALFAVAALTYVLATRHPAPVQHPDRAIEERLFDTPVWRSRYALTVALFTLLLFAVLTIGDYQFKAIATVAYPERDRLASFMGFFYGAVGALSLAVQLLMPRLLSRYGVLGGIVAMPAAFITATGALFLSPSLAIASVLKASDHGLQFTVHDTATQLLLFPFPQALRERVRTLASAVAKPVGCGVGATLLIVVSASTGTADGGEALIHDAARLGLYSLPLGLVVIGLTPRLRQGYIEAMRRTLVRRGIGSEDVVVGPQTRAIFEEALFGDDAPQVLFAIDQLRSLSPEILQSAAPRLTRHRSARVRATALRLLVEVGGVEGAPELARRALRDPSELVRVAGVEVLSELLREDAHEELCRLSKEGDDATQAAAIAALMRHGGLDGMLDGAPRLRELLDSADAKNRIAAARALGMVGQQSLQRALARLIADTDPEVRREAVKAACTVADPRLIPLLVGALADRGLSRVAGRALSVIGQPAIPELTARLADPATPREARKMMPRILAASAHLDALDGLVGCIDEPDEGVRQKILASASRLRLTLQAPAVDKREVLAWVTRELDEHEHTRDRYLAARPVIAGPLLDQHLLRRLRQGLIRALRVCELGYPREEIALARTHVLGADPALRANALEVLDALLERPLFERLSRLLEGLVELRAGGFVLTKARNGAAGGSPSGQQAEAQRREAAVWVRGELARGQPYSAALVLDAAARHGLMIVAESALSATSHADPLVREAAAIAVAALSPEGARERLTALSHDEDPVVARYAHYWLETGRVGLDEDDTMYTTIEKILFLQRVPLFAGVAGDDLVALARGSIVVSLRKGDVIFREGESGGSLYLIIAGAVALSTQGRELAHLGNRDVFGEMSILDRDPRTATATVTEDAELLRVSAEDFHEAIHDTVEIAEAVIRVLNRRLRDADRLLAEARPTPALPEGQAPGSTMAPRAGREDERSVATSLDESDDIE